MAFELEHGPRLGVLGVGLVLAGGAITVQFFRTLPEESFVYILPYLLPAVLLAVGGVLVFGEAGRRIRR